MRGVWSRFSDWIVAHPILWSVGAGLVLVLLGIAFGLPPVVVLVAGVVVGVLNIVHARRRGYCPLPAPPSAPPERTEGE